MKRIVLLTIVGMLLFSCLSVKLGNVAADSTSFYVSNDGDNSNSGTSQSSPWRTIAKVNSEFGGAISAGDDIYFKRGDTFNDDDLLIELGGTASDKMIIGAYGSGDRPRFTFSGDAKYSLIYVDDGSIGHIKIENLIVIDNGNTGYNNKGIGSTRGGVTDLTISNCRVSSCGQAGILLQHVNGYVIEDCDIYNCGNGGIVIYGSSSDKVRNGIIRNCNTYNMVTNDGITLHRDSGLNDVGPNHYIVNCVAYNNPEQGFDFTSGSNIIIKNCEGYNNGPANSGGVAVGNIVSRIFIDNYYSHDETQGGAEAIQIVGGNNIVVRKSVIYRSRDDMFFMGYTNGKDIGNVKGVHNTIVWTDFSDDYPFRLGGSNEHYGSKIFKNNIIYSTDSNDPDTFVLYGDGNTFSNTDSEYSNNIWWRGDGGSANNDWWNDAASGTYTWSEWQAASFTSNEMRDDPDLANPTNGDFSLDSTSPCIDAGCCLTTCNGGGSGTTITLQDASYFCDGFGLTDGDTIRVGSNEVTITGVNYGTNVITVDSSISWSNGDPVSYAYHGSAPDIGAKETASSGGDTTPPVISNINVIESDPLDTDESFGWINITATVTDNTVLDNVLINITSPNGSTYSFSMNSAGSTYYYHTSSVFSTHGDFSYYIWANDIHGNQKTSGDHDFSMPPNWDINNDGSCSVLDLNLVSNHYGETGATGWIREDVDNNGIIQVLDLILITEHYNEEW